MKLFRKFSYVVVLLMMVAIETSAATISGVVRLDANRDGWPSMEEPGLSGMLVSDGYGFAVTDAKGEYTLELHPKAQSLYVQRNDRYTADITRFWHRITPGRKQYDFLMEAARPVSDNTLTIAIIGDSETHGFANASTANLSFMEEIRRYIANHPEVDLFVNAGDISAQNPIGMETQRDFVNVATMGRPVVYACGNHDVDFRGKGLYGQQCPFLSIYGPWWESFELGGYLFVVVPIYNSWGAPLLYDMLDCGDWLKELCRRYPDKKKIMIAHDLPDLTGYKMATHTGDLNLDDEKFVCAFYAHKHMNIVKKYPSGRKAFCVAAPNKGGAGCFAPSFRVVHINRTTDEAESDLFYTHIHRHLRLITPHNGLARNEKQDMAITADAYDGGDEVIAVTAHSPAGTIDLSRTSPIAWSGRANWPQNGDIRITLTAKTRSGNEFSRDFTVATKGTNRLAWLAQLPTTIAMCDLMLVNGLLIVGVSDDENAEKGGVYSLDAATGKIAWFYRTGYGIRNNIATDGKRLFAIDTRANIHAVDAVTGQRLWLNPSDPTIVSPAASGIVYQDGIVAGGYGRHLRGIRAADGQTLWKNTGWQVEERTPAEDKLAVTPDGSLFVISRLNGLYRHELKTGRVVWQHKTLFANSSPLPDGNSVWLVGGYGNLCQLDQTSGKLVKEIKPFPCHSTTAAPVKLPNGLLLVASSLHGLGALDPVSGKECWRFKPEASITPTGDYDTGNPPAVTATPLWDDGKLWVAANDGRLYQLNPQDGKVLESFSVGMPILNCPCADASRIFISDCFGRVMAITK